MCHHYFSADAICNCPKPSNLDYNDQSGNNYDGKFKIQIHTQNPTKRTQQKIDPAIFFRGLFGLEIFGYFSTSSFHSDQY